MKNFGRIVLLLIVLILIGIWSPWHNWDFSFLSMIGIENDNSYSTLKVKSLSGSLDIYIDDKLEGSVVADESFAEINTIKEGMHLVKLKRQSENGDIYFELNKEINFISGVEVVMAYDLGPSEAFSEGHILYTSKNYKKNQNPVVNIISSPEDVNVFIDDEQIGTTPISELELDLSRQHKIRFEKTGYDSLEFMILPEDQESRDKLKDLTINLEVNLFLQPVKIIKNT